MKTAAAFTNSQEAHLCRIKLENSGVAAIVVDDITAQVAPHLANAIGGIRVQVPDDEIENALVVLREERPPQPDLREGLTCPKCGAEDVAPAIHEKRSYVLSFLILILMMFPFPIIKRRYQCMKCNHLWK